MYLRTSSELSLEPLFLAEKKSLVAIDCVLDAKESRPFSDCVTRRRCIEGARHRLSKRLGIAHRYEFAMPSVLQDLGRSVTTVGTDNRTAAALSANIDETPAPLGITVGRWR